MASDAAPEYPDVWQNDAGEWHVRCHSETERDLSQKIGDGSLLAVYDWLREIAVTVDLELSESEDGDQAVISIPPGA